jgi:hypothetical protein
MTSYFFRLDPILAMALLSEYTFMSFSRIHEPFVRNLLLQRALVVLAIAACVDAAVCALFIFVPGKKQ